MTGAATRLETTMLERPPDVAVPAGTRLLHIGPPATAGGIVRRALRTASRVLSTAGAEYVPADVLDAADRSPATLRDRWGQIASLVSRAEASRLVISADSLAGADPATIGEVVDSLERRRVHVVATLRPLADAIPRAWVAAVVAGHTAPFESWLEGVIGDHDDPSRDDRMLAAWAAAVGAEHVSAIVATNGSDVLSAFEGLLGLGAGSLVAPADPAARDLTAPEVEVLRAFNARCLSLGLARERYDRQVRDGAVPRLLARTPGLDEPVVTLPPASVDRVRERAAAVVAGLESSGIRIIGDAAKLAAVPHAQEPHELSVGEATWAEIGAAAAVGLLPPDLASRGRIRVEPIELAGMSTPRLGLLLARRALRSARRRITRPGPRRAG